MAALNTEITTLDESIERVAARVLMAAREFERLKWLAQDLEVGALLPVEAYSRFLVGQVHWPGQRERAIAALSIHPEPEAREVLAAWQAPEKLDLLRRVALAAHPGEIQ